MANHKKQHGAVSLFIVVFTALLITVITVSFIHIMVLDQQQASTADLSQSAYDSAQAGVEDAKRALLRYQSICDSGGACAAAATKINSSVCNAGLDGIVDTSGSEVQVKEDSGGNALNQAYTCVRIQLATADYLGVLQADDSKVIPLVGTSPFDTVQLQWFSSQDLQTGNNSTIDLLPGSALTQPLLVQSAWQPNRPSIMRSQLMQFGTSFNLSDFNDTNAQGQSNANTLFLYPTGTTGMANSTVDTAAFEARDARKTATGKPLPITCSGNLTGGGYACSVNLILPTPIGGGNRTAFLRLSALYNKTDYRVTLSNGSTPVTFAGVQPQIDSTGRANDLFRRVESRVEMVDTNFPYPDAAVDTTGNFCKDFLITDNTTDYKNNCTP